MSNWRIQTDTLTDIFTTPPSNTTAQSSPGVGQSAAVGATIGTAILPGIGTALGAAIGAIASSGLFGHGRTARIDYEQYEPIAAQASHAIVDNLQRSGYQNSRVFMNILYNNAVAFIAGNNPGQAGERQASIDAVTAAFNTGRAASVWELISYPMIFSISGVSTDPNDRTGIAWRINQVFEQVVVPSVSAYETQMGIGSGGTILTPTGQLTPAPGAGNSATMNPAVFAGGLAVAYYLFFL